MEDGTDPVRDFIPHEAAGRMAMGHEISSWVCAISQEGYMEI